MKNVIISWFTFFYFLITMIILNHSHCPSISISLSLSINMLYHCTDFNFNELVYQIQIYIMIIFFVLRHSMKQILYNQSNNLFTMSCYLYHSYHFLSYYWTEIMLLPLIVISRQSIYHYFVFIIVQSHLQMIHAPETALQ